MASQISFEDLRRNLLYEISCYTIHAKGFLSHVKENKNWYKVPLGDDSTNVSDYYGDKLIQKAQAINNLILQSPYLISQSAKKKQITFPIHVYEKIKIANQFFALASAKQDLLNYIQSTIDESEELYKNVSMPKRSAFEGTSFDSGCLKNTAYIILFLTVIYLCQEMVFKKFFNSHD